MEPLTDSLFRDDVLLELLVDLDRRFGVRALGDEASGPGVILRHDVDMDLRPAHRLGRLEHDRGLRGTYFVLTSCPLYNVLAEPNRRRLRDLVDWGFEVGLHFDPLAYGDAAATDAPTLKARADREAELLASVTGAAVTSLSMHNPSVHGRYDLIDGYRNAYDPSIFDPSCYVTDSRRRLPEHARAVLERAGERAIQLVLHPLHYSPNGHGYDHIMSRYVLDIIEEVERNFAVNEEYRAAVDPGLVHAVEASIRRELDRGA